MESVDLIAMGYEWECPDCEKYNCESGVPDSVVCKECNKEFKVGDYDHVYE